MTKQYEIRYEKFHDRWIFKPKGLPGALQVAKTKADVLEKALPICGNHQCILRICDEAGNVAEERAFNVAPGR